MEITRLHLVALVVRAAAQSTPALPSAQPSVPQASLMIYQDGQAFKDMDGVDLTRAAGNEKRIAGSISSTRMSSGSKRFTWRLRLIKLKRLVEIADEESLIVMNAIRSS